MPRNPRRPPAPPRRTRNRPAQAVFHDPRRLLAAALAAAFAFALYATTLLPGQDLGDTASFQAIAGERVLSPRQGYPLYFAVTGLAVHALPLERAHAANMASAVLGAAAVGVVALVGAELAGSALAGLVAALLLGASYTFWSQAIIAEVYALHLFILAACLLALLRWAERPSTPRLAFFFLLVAIGFGNHLSMVLLLPGFTLFLLVTPPGPRALLRPRILLLASGIALAGALQYLWNLSPVLGAPDQPPPLEVLRSFWFDVTKSDWRSTMVGAIPRQRMPARLAMYWFDLRQQFGVPGAVAAVLGAFWLLRRDWRRWLLVATLFLVNWTFAFTYNVGDAHVFFLPSHLLVALFAGCGVAFLLGTLTRLDRSARTTRPAAALLAIALAAYPSWRAWDTWPALDRSGDLSPRQFFDRLTAGLTGDREILASDMGWQLHNGIDYYSLHTKTALGVFNVPSGLLHFPFVAWNNLAAGRDVVLTEGAARLVTSTYGNLLPVEPDLRLPTPTLEERLGAVPVGTPYVLTILQPYPEAPLDQQQLGRLARLLRVEAPGLPMGRYVAVAGEVGRGTRLRVAGDEPFRRTVELEGRAVDIRMEAWLPTDSIRRAGFGHVISGRRHLLTLYRGLSFVSLTPEGGAGVRTWEGGQLMPQGRWIIKASRQPAP